MDTLANAQIGGATAQVAREGVVDVFIAGLRIIIEQRGGGHDLAGLAVAALRHVQFLPSLLQRMLAFGVQTLDGGDLFAADSGYRRHASAGWHTVEMHRTSTTLADAATELGAYEAERIAQHPQQRGVGGDIDGMSAAVDGKGVFAHGKIVLTVGMQFNQI